MTPATRRPTRTGKNARPTSSELERGRATYARQAWQDAFEALSHADRETPLEDQDLERLVWAAALAGHNEVHLATLERLHDLRAATGNTCAAARAAFWLGMRLLTLGEVGRATGWLARAEHLVENEKDCLEHGYLLIPRGYVALFRKNAAVEACEAARQATEIGDRLGEPDLANLARMLHGQARAALGDHEAGLALLDESMLAATRGLLSPLVTGIVYCAVIGCCQRLYAIDRAREWTAALGTWCRSQPQMVAFSGACLVHRSEILQLQGAWQEAIDEARRATEGFVGAAVPDGVGSAFYQQGEILRLRGEFDAAESAYRSASQHGREPHPGLALLRLARGQTTAAAAAIRQVVASVPDPHARTRYLPAAVEILLAAGDLAGAEEAARSLEEVAAHTPNEILDALASHARGSVRHARGDAQAALEPLRRAFSTWQRNGAPYLAARLRTQIAAVLSELGDDEGAELEREAARAVFRDLGATSDLEQLKAPRRSPADHPFGLTPRELEVLRLVASGHTNRTISRELFLSEKTIDRHVSNIFSKLDVPTRSAATAFAYQHKLV
jgi:ATP/maltotriose-dependent transcriptional regulator MalT